VNGYTSRRLRAPARPVEGDQAEAIVVWRVMAIVAVEVLTTYWRTPPAELYHLAASGLDVAIHQSLGILAFPTGLLAIAITGIAVDRHSGRLVVAVALAAAALGAMVFLPGGLDEGDLDARPVTLLPLVGVAAAVSLTALAAHRHGAGRLGPGLPGDRLRLGFGIVLLVIGLPWMAADLGLLLTRCQGSDACTCRMWRRRSRARAVPFRLSTMVITTVWMVFSRPQRPYSSRAVC
jgi:hypothetical protein